MDTDKKREWERIREKVIWAAYAVHNVLGYGYLEKVYENALAHELRKAGLSVEQQKRVTVMYDGVEVGEYVADLIVEGVVLVELKAARALDEAHVAQSLNYMKCTGLAVCLVLNFGKRVDVKRLLGPNA